MKKYFVILALLALLGTWMAIESVDEARYLEQNLANWQVAMAIVALLATLAFIGLSLFWKDRKR
jgi:hypothetical protein